MGCRSLVVAFELLLVLVDCDQLRIANYELVKPLWFGLQIAIKHTNCDLVFASFFKPVFWVLNAIFISKCCMIPEAYTIPPFST